MLLKMELPPLGESISEVTMGEWAIQDGQYIEKGQTICEVHSDKASFDLLSEKSGIVTIIAKEGDEIKVNDLICTIDVHTKGQKIKITPLIERVSEIIKSL